MCTSVLQSVLIETKIYLKWLRQMATIVNSQWQVNIRLHSLTFPPLHTKRSLAVCQWPYDLVRTHMNISYLRLAGSWLPENGLVLVSFAETARKSLTLLMNGWIVYVVLKVQNKWLSIIGRWHDSSYTLNPSHFWHSLSVVFCWISCQSKSNQSLSSTEQVSLEFTISQAYSERDSKILVTIKYGLPKRAFFCNALTFNRHNSRL